METLKGYQRPVLKRAFIARIPNLSKAYIDRTITSYKKFDAIAILPVAFGFETSLRDANYCILMSFSVKISPISIEYPPK